MSNAITKGMILNISSNADVYARGEKYYRDGKLLSLKKQEEADGNTAVKATVEGNYKNYDVTIRLEQDGSLKHYTCSCESHSIWRGACKHVVAVLFALTDGHVNVLAPEKMRQAARGLTDALEKIIFDDIDASLTVERAAPANPVRLAPCFHYERNGEAYLTFTVGHSRMYIIKNLSIFLSSVRREETVGYGSGLKFNHTPAMFAADCRPLLDFLLREDALYAEVAKRVNRQYQYMQNAGSNARALPLSERNMDDFFALYAGGEMDAVIEQETQLQFTDEMPVVRLHLQHEASGTTVSADDFNYRVVHGQRFHYFVSLSHIHRVPMNDALILIHLLKTLAAAPDARLFFGGGEQSRFLSIILPKLLKLGLIGDVSGQAPVREADALCAKLYFDYEGRDIICRVSFDYGDASFNPLDDDTPSSTPNHAGADILRDAAAEYAVKRRLTVHGFYADNTRKGYVLVGNDAIFAFLHGTGDYGAAEEPNNTPPMLSGIDQLRDCAEVYVSETLNRKAIKVKTPSLGVRLQGNLLDIQMENAGFTFNELLDALEAYRARKKFYRLRDGRFLPLEGEAVAMVADLLTSLDVSRKEAHGDTLSLPAYRALYVDELTKDKRIEKTVHHNSSFTQLVAQFHSDTAQTFEIPESMQSVLRAYQKTGYQWLKTLSHYGFGGILADDMGLGKTIQIITLLLSEQRIGVRSLVVAPTSLLYNWEHEIRRFAPSLRTVVVTGLPEKRHELLQTPDIDVFITTYDMMKRDINAYEDIHFEYVIADEAQNIKNPSTQNAKAIKDLNARVRFALTGTPIENTLTELWSIFDFIMPGYLHSSHKFNRLYEYPIVRNNDTDRAARLRRQIEPFVLRRVKKNVLTELPDKTETILLAEMSPEQRKLYLASLLKARGELDALTASGSFEDGRMRILAQLTRLRQICCHPALFVEGYKGGSGKLDLALETIQMAIESGHRLLLFSQFTMMLDILRRTLDETPFHYFYLDGATKAQDRIDMTNRFNAGERDMFLISLKAGGTGLNLTGADVVMHYDPWWNPSVMDQASDRAHRYGQEKAVQIFNVVAKDTIEEKIMELQEKKRNLIDSVITEGGSFINTLSEAEVRSLFNGV